jgi:EAL domain-containing protein (putative c-di-GMP-specific phosphodiesterase class I)
MSLAQSTLRAAKTRGKNRVVLANPNSNIYLDAVYVERYRSLIQDALAQDRLVIHLQPILEIEADVISRYEALVRIIDPAGDLIPPDEWIPNAEDLHLIEDVDKHVVTLSLAHWSQMARAGGDAGISINVSGQSINREMAKFIVEMISASGASPGKVTIEVTETALVGDTTDLECFLRIVRNAGARVAVDDYGSGNTSLRRIRTISFDTVKLDGSLIQEIATSESDQMFATALTELFHSMGFDVVAEYVEDQKTLQFLAEIGVDYAQGYYVGRPVPASEMQELANTV